MMRVHMRLAVTNRHLNTWEERESERQIGDMAANEFELLMAQLKAQAQREVFRQDINQWQFTRDSGQIHEVATVTISE